VRVAVDPLTAFTAFTEEIDSWWVRGPINFWDAARAVAMRIEPGLGGRVLEVYDDASGDALELGRITTWEPGSRFTYRSSVDDTEVDIRFEPVPEGTDVHVRHYVRPGGDADKAALFWPNVIHWFANWRTGQEHRPREVARLHVALHYEDPPAAARWLAEAFGLTSRDRIPAKGTQPEWIELHVGDVPVLLFPLAGPRPEGPVTHGVWVFVDDLDAHFAHAKAHGATIVSEIHQHGYRCYEAADPDGHRWTFAQARPTMPKP
jgi:uncharacterized glyoxalase superfamily protein PhnB